MFPAGKINRDTLEWKMNYDPYDCGRNRCAGMCPVLGHELDMKRGNVFYDVNISYLRNDLNGTPFEGQVDTRIINGKKLFGHPEKRDSGNKRERRRQSRESAVRLPGAAIIFFMPVFSYNHPYHCSANLDILDKKRFL